MGFLADIGKWLGSAVVMGGKNVSKGTAQQALGIQSPQLGSSMIRIGRFLYVTSLGWITVSWYTGYVNERTHAGKARFILPGSRDPIIGSPDRPDKSLPNLGGGGGDGGGLLQLPWDIAKGIGSLLGVSYKQSATGGARTLVPLAPNQLGVPGTAVAGYLWSAQSKQIPAYHAATYRSLIPVASTIANQFHLRISSAYRPNSQGSLHGAGLAFDMVGSMSDMKRAATWAAQNPGLFQEIFVHDEGSGMHLHLGFYPDAAQIFNSGSNRYNRASTGPAPPQTVPRRPTVLT